jgi:hypothetical protein
LPLMMGVKAEKVRLTEEEARSTTAIKTLPMWPAGLGRNAKYYTCNYHMNNVFALVNAMQKVGGQVFLVNQAGHDPYLVFGAHAQLAANAEKLHLLLPPREDLPKEAKPLKPPRIGLYKPYIPSIDEGWTRFVLEQYGFNVKNIENKEVKAGNLNNAYDVIILPDSTRQVIVEGRPTHEGYFEELPPEYKGGIGKEGVRVLKDFVEKGGTLITLARASEVVMGEEFNLPVRNTLGGARERGRGVQTSNFNIPGSLLRVFVDTNHPVGYGMPKEIAAFYDHPIAFQTSAPTPDIQRSVVAWYPDNSKDILLSGYARGAEQLQRHAAVVSFTKGKGKIVMFGFRVQHRAQTEGTFQMLFNAILW